MANKLGSRGVRECSSKHLTIKTNPRCRVAIQLLKPKCTQINSGIYYLTHTFEYFLPMEGNTGTKQNKRHHFLPAAFTIFNISQELKYSVLEGCLQSIFNVTQGTPASLLILLLKVHHHFLDRLFSEQCLYDMVFVQILLLGSFMNIWVYYTNYIYLCTMLMKPPSTSPS